MEYVMDNETASEILKREQRRAEIDAAELATAQREAEDLAEAQRMIPQWNKEYDDLLLRRQDLASEIETTDKALVEALDELKAAHKRALSLLERRRQAELSANGLHARLSRLGNWTNRDWRKDIISIGPTPISRRIESWTSRPWPSE